MKKAAKKKATKTVGARRKKSQKRSLPPGKVRDVFSDKDLKTLTGFLGQAEDLINSGSGAGSIAIRLGIAITDLINFVLIEDKEEE